MSNPRVQQEYAEAVAAFRAQKDTFFRDAPQSPLSASDRKDFAGLSYFTPDFTYRVEATVERLPGGDMFEMQTTDGATRQFERYARLHFTLDDTACALTGYRSVHAEALLEEMGDEHMQLFVPFRDAWSGKVTYPAGRYLDVEVEADEHGQPIVLLDFNLAYNPYCAYNDLYSCPITPFENTLPIPVPVGEKTPHA